MKTIVARLKQTHIYPVTWNFTCSKKINIWPLFKVICFRVIFFFFFFRLTISYVFMHTENLKNPIEYQTCFRYKRGQREPKWTKHFKWELFFLIPSLICMQFIHWITVCPNRKEFHIKEFNNFFFYQYRTSNKNSKFGCLSPLIYSNLRNSKTYNEYVGTCTLQTGFFQRNSMVNKMHTNKI